MRDRLDGINRHVGYLVTSVDSCVLVLSNLLLHVEVVGCHRKFLDLAGAHLLSLNLPLAHTLL